MIKFIFAENEETLKACLNVRRTVFIEEMGVSENIEIDENDVLTDKCVHILVLRENKPIGTARCNKISDRTLKIQRFCFLKEERCNGYGKELLNFIEREFKKIGVTHFFLEAKHTACDFYQKSGYKPIGDFFYEANVKHIKMEKVFV